MAKYNRKLEKICAAFIKAARDQVKGGRHYRGVTADENRNKKGLGGVKKIAGRGVGGPEEFAPQERRRITPETKRTGLIGWQTVSGGVQGTRGYLRERHRLKLSLRGHHHGKQKEVNEKGAT